VKFKIKTKELQEIVAGQTIEFPKYSTQIINLANQNSQGTRPNVVGQLSDLIQEFDGRTHEEWERWYLEKMPDAIESSVDKIFPMIEKLKDVIQYIDKKLIKKWVKDLVITKTFMGLRFQEAILKKIADRDNIPYRLATPEEESNGIDGFIGKQAVSIKPSTYKAMKNLSESIDIPIIFYEKKKDGISVEYDI